MRTMRTRLAIGPHYNASHGRIRQQEAQCLLELAAPPSCLRPAFPAIYARETPTLFGFPFFYWYQFAWVFLTAAITGLVYFLVKD